MAAGPDNCRAATNSAWRLSAGIGFYTMYEMSDPAVGYAKRISFSDDAVPPARIAIAKMLITSSACGPSTCAPRIRPDGFSTSTLKPECVSPTRREEFQEAVSPWRTSKARPR
jgi:hypothetical protein